MGDGPPESNRSKAALDAEADRYYNKGWRERNRLIVEAPEKVWPELAWLFTTSSVTTPSVPSSPVPLPPPLCPSCFWKNPHHPSSCLKDEFPGYRYGNTLYQCRDHSACSAEVTPEKQTERNELLERWNRQMKLYKAQNQAYERIYNRVITIFVLFAIIVNCLIVFLLSMPPQKWLILVMTLPPSIGAAVAIGEVRARKIAHRKTEKLSEQTPAPKT